MLRESESRTKRENQRHKQFVSWPWIKKLRGHDSDGLIEGTVKFGGGNVMVWGCIGWDGVGYETRIEGKMDAPLYVSILEDELQDESHFYNKTTANIIFQQQ